MDNNIDNIDDLFREGFADYAETPPPAVWQGLERRLDNDKKRRVFPFRWFWYIGILIVAVVLGAGMLYLPDFGKETVPVATPIGTADVLPLADAAVADKVKSSAKESAAHTMPAQKDDVSHLNNSSSTTQQAVESNDNKIADLKNNRQEQKITATRKANKANENVQDAAHAAQNTTLNAAATGTSMYSYDDFEQEKTPENKKDVSGATLELEAGYVVSKKRKNKMLVVEQLPEGMAAEESKNTNNNEGNSNGVSMKGRGVQIAKASTGNAADVPSGKIADIGVEKSGTIPELTQDVRSGDAINGGAAIASSKDDKRVEHVAATNKKAGKSMPNKHKNAPKKIVTTTNEQQRVAVKHKPTSVKNKVAATSKGSEKKTAVPKAIASVLAANKKGSKNNVAFKEVATKYDAGSSKPNAAKSETASVADNTGKVSAAIAKNTSVAVGTSETKTTDATGSKGDADKGKVAQQKALEKNKNTEQKVAAKHTATAEKTAATSSVVADKQSNVSEKRTPKVNDKTEVKKAAFAERKDEKKATVNSEVVATSATAILAADKKVVQTKAINDVAKKEVIASNEKAKNEKKKGVGEEQKKAMGYTGNEQGTKNKKQSVKYGDAVATKSSEKAGKGTTKAHAIAAKTATRKAEKETNTANAVTTKSTKKAVNGISPSTAIAAKTATRKAEKETTTANAVTTTNTERAVTETTPSIAAKAATGKAKQTTGGKQQGIAKGEAHVAEEARVNAASPATVAKNMGGKQGGVKTLNTGILAAGKWKPDNSLPEETKAADYVMKKEIKPVLEASEKVMEAANRKVDSTIAVVTDSAVITAADSVKKDSATHKNRFVIGVKAGVEMGVVTGGANKVVVSPYLQYKLSERLSLMVQPALKMAGLSTRNVGTATNYYDVNPGTGSYKLTDSALLILVLTGDTLWNRNYEYTERYDSVVKTNKTGGNYMEIELPLLLQYKVTKRLSVYGGVNTVYGNKLGVTEHTYTAKAVPKTGYVNTLAQFYAPAPTPTGTGITYTGSPLSGYTGPQYPSETGGLFRFGYMFGLSYEVRKRWLADVLVQQCIAQQNLVAGYNVNRPLSVPYFRFTLGYRLSKQ